MSSLIYESKIPKRYKSIGMRQIDRWLFSLYAARAASSTSRTFFSLLFSVSLYFMCVYYSVIENTKKVHEVLELSFSSRYSGFSFSFSKTPAAIFPPHIFHHLSKPQSFVFCRTLIRMQKSANLIPALTALQS